MSNSGTVVTKRTTGFASRLLHKALSERDKKKIEQHISNPTVKADGANETKLATPAEQVASGAQSH